jgi:hypothetical protein
LLHASLLAVWLLDAPERALTRRGAPTVGVSYQPLRDRPVAMRLHMTVLRRALQAFAAIWALSGAALIVVPRWVLVDVFDQPPPPDQAYAQIAGAGAITLAMLAVLVSRREDVWWWSTAFAIETALCATIAALHAAIGLPEGASGPLWWLFAAVSAALTAWLLLGLTRASQEHPVA